MRHSQPKKLKGFIFYSGPSLLDGSPIVGIAVRTKPKGANRKTGAMVQTYILRSDIDPVTATKNGSDLSICGDCKHRKAELGSCYVRVENGPLTVYKKYKQGGYVAGLPLESLAKDLTDDLVRLGAYGDPAAIPISVWSTLLSSVGGVTGYTHQWQGPAFQGLKQYCMASVDTLDEHTEALANNWRTFFVVPSNSQIASRKGLLLCPASEQAGKKLTCEECLACGGFSSTHKASVYIPVHGVAYKQARFNNNLIQIARA